MSLNPNVGNIIQAPGRTRRLTAAVTLFALLFAGACSGGSKQDVLDDAKKHGGVHFLPKGKDCPAGGEPFVVPGSDNAYLVMVSPEDPTDPASPIYAVLAEQTYKGLGSVVCGPDADDKLSGMGVRFKGKAVVGPSASARLVAFAFEN